MLEVWPALLVAGVTFAIPQFLVSNYHGPWLVDILAASCSMVCLAFFLRHWRRGAAIAGRRERAAMPAPLRVALMPWVILTVIVFAWGTPQMKTFLNHISAPSIPIAGLDKLVLRMPPVVAQADAGSRRCFIFNWLSASGTAILIAAMLSGFVLGYSTARARSEISKDDRRRVAIAAHDRGDAGARLHDALLGRGRDSRIGVRAHRRRLPVLRGDARLARRRAHRQRHVVERAVRQPAEDHRERRSA